MADQQRATGEPFVQVDQGTRRSARPSLLPDDGDAGLPARAHLLPLVALDAQLNTNSLSGFGMSRPLRLPRRAGEQGVRLWKGEAALHRRIRPLLQDLGGGAA